MAHRNRLQRYSAKFHKNESVDMEYLYKVYKIAIESLIIKRSSLLFLLQYTGVIRTKLAEIFEQQTSISRESLTRRNESVVLRFLFIYLDPIHNLSEREKNKHRVAVKRIKRKNCTSS